MYSSRLHALAPKALCDVSGSIGKDEIGCGMYRAAIPGQVIEVLAGRPPADENVQHFHTGIRLSDEIYTMICVLSSINRFQNV